MTSNWATADPNAVAREIAADIIAMCRDQNAAGLLELSDEEAIGNALVAVSAALARARQEGRHEGMVEMREAALKCQPSTAENPYEDAYEQGRFDGVIEFGRAIAALPVSAPGEAQPEKA